MRRMQIAVGSTRRPKLEALRDAASQIAPLFGAGTTLEVVGCEVDSGVSHTPTSRDELMQGARQGAEALREKLQAEGARANFYVGLECGLDLVEANGVRRVFLES